MSYHNGTCYCSFCGKSEHEVRKLITMADIAVCNECVGVCADILRDEGIDTGAQFPNRYSLPNFGAIRKAIRSYMSK